MKFMLPVLFAIIFSAVNLFPQKAGSQDNTVPAVTNTSENPRITYANSPNQTNTVTWYPLVQNGNNGVYGGTSPKVNCILVAGGYIYIAGTFASAGGNQVKNIVRWDGSGFTALENGVDGTVNALAYYNGNIVAGGAFSSVGGNENIKYIAQWNGSSWSSVGGGVNNIVHALIVSNGVLYVGGEFITANQASNFNRIASWNGTSWTSYGSGFTDPVKAIAVSGSNIYAAGLFTESGGNPGNYIAKWDGSWSSLGTGTDGAINALTLSGTDLYAGGSFTTAGGVSSNCVAKWNGSSWSALSNPDGSEVYSLTTHNSVIYAGTENNVRKFKANAWTNMAHLLGIVRTLAVNESDQSMYVGGDFANVTPAENAELILLNKVGKFTDTDDPLPVELTSFSAKRVSGGVELRWATATEVNNYGFEIERAAAVETMHASSLQERNWENIDFVPGHGNSNSPKQYIYRDNNSRADQGYIYRLKQVDSDGSFSYSGELYVSAGAPASFELKQNFPNPFNPVTMISYTLPSSGMVQLKIYNTTGEEVAALVNEIQDAGSYQISFNGSGLASGTYLYRITVTSDAGVYTQSRKMIILK
ncbi:MAG: hypothetical protein FMNOHCHN_01706 [Ignavibacteriaceae bacterium]|nr:hypothetical protein [Ignavibacteriaceae bacterium]